MSLGYVSGLNATRLEKNLLFTRGTGIQLRNARCDLHCSYCQNWVTSQALRDPSAAAVARCASRPQIVLDALRQRGRVVVSTL